MLSQRQPCRRCGSVVCVRGGRKSHRQKAACLARLPDRYRQAAGEARQPRQCGASRAADVL